MFKCTKNSCRFSFLQRTTRHTVHDKPQPHMKPLTFKEYLWRKGLCFDCCSSSVKPDWLWRVVTGIEVWLVIPSIQQNAASPSFLRWEQSPFNRPFCQTVEEIDGTLYSSIWVTFACRCESSGSKSPWRIRSVLDESVWMHCCFDCSRSNRCAKYFRWSKVHWVGPEDRTLHTCCNRRYCS